MAEIAKYPSQFFGSAMTSRFSLAAKLYSIFALFAVLVAVITALSDYNTRQNAELTEAVATASRAALNVERVNSLVYAVVMESRGVYMSTDPAVVKKYGDGLLKFNERILEVVKNWQALVQADDAQQFATFKKRIEQFIEFRKELVRRGVEINAAAGREWGDNDANREVRTALNKDLEALSRVYAERSKKLAQQTDTNHTMAFVLTCLGIFALVVVVMGVLIIARSIARPLSVDHGDHQAGRRWRRRGAKFRTPAAPTRSARWPARSRSFRRRWIATATSIRRCWRIRGRATSAPATSKPRSTPSGRRSAACCAPSPTMRPRCAIPPRPSRAFRPTRADAPWRRPARPSRLPATFPPSPAPPKNSPLRSRKSAARFASRPAPSSRRASAPKNRSPKSKASRPRPSASTACSP